MTMTASLALAAGLVAPSPGLAADIAAVAAIDTAYQAAVERNDADAMDEMLGDDFVLVLGNGTAFDRKDLLRWAREGKASYTRQVEDAGTQTVRVWGDTAVVTARLWEQGTRKDGSRFDQRLWFSDVYVRTATGWKYVFGQASLPLPADASDW